MSGEISRRTVEEAILQREVDDSHLDCRHDLPSVDPFSTLRRAFVGIVCLNCSGRWTGDPIPANFLLEIKPVWEGL